MLKRQLKQNRLNKINDHKMRETRRNPVKTQQINIKRRIQTVRHQTRFNSNICFEKDFNFN